LIVFPNCKINLGLNIINKREDGYHNLETVFYPLYNIKDCLEILPANKNSFTTSGLKLDVDAENNICTKAWRVLKSDYKDLPYVQIHLHKTIPAGAGLGGGSSNGAFTLQCLNKLFQLNLSTTQLLHYALKLGSDCPFFIINSVCFATLRGEELQPIKLHLDDYYFVIVNPQIHVSTAIAFSKIKPQKPKHSIAEIIKQPINTWKENLINDFELCVFELYPTIKEIKDNLYKQGAIYVSMSGTGSTVFGIFAKSILFHNIFPATYFVRVV
jgi:4-diphosphocytidyl-2-C-methyl-D-erythritol kinase